jgi:conjugative relaxase-like TrwC/TraI family protein
LSFVTSLLVAGYFQLNWRWIFRIPVVLLLLGGIAFYLIARDLSRNVGFANDFWAWSRPLQQERQKTSELGYLRHTRECASSDKWVPPTMEAPMVATIAAGTTAQYYTKQAEYYLGGGEPAGRWISATNNFGVAHGTAVDNATFERLHAGLDETGQPLLTNPGDPSKRVAGLDLTLSAPKSVSIAYALADSETRTAIEDAQHRACEATVAFLDRHAAFCRRGKNGAHLESIQLTVASFQHGESRPVEHEDGSIFADPNLHSHQILLNCAVRADGTIGALDARQLFAFKMAAGSAYHVALSSNLQRIGFNIGEIGKNGTFEIVDERGGPGQQQGLALRRFMSARRQEIEQILAEEGLTTAGAPALAAAVALGTRTSKQEEGPSDRFAIWADQASQFVDVERYVADLRTYREPDPAEREAVIAERMAVLPSQLTEHESLFEQRHLLAAIGTALVGTGVGAERIDLEAQRFVEAGRVVQLGRDKLGQPIYSTPQQIALERELLALTERLLGQRRRAPDAARVAELCRAHGLTDEQANAARAATTASAIAVVEGAPGVGKTTMLRPVVAVLREAGMRVVGTATAWNISNQFLELGIESKATDAWIASAKAGGKFLDRNTVLLIEESSLLSSRQMYALLSEIEKAGAKAILIGDRQQLQAIGAGPGLTIVASLANATRVDTIVRQHDKWAREAVTDFSNGRTAEALKAFASRGLITTAAGEKASINAMVDAWEATQATVSNPATLLIAKTNAQVTAINAEVRRRLKTSNLIRGPEIAVAAVSRSGSSQTLQFALGDRVRFSLRYDALGVINGTVATVTHIDRSNASDPTIHVAIGERLARFRLSDIADEMGRARLGHAYATTIYGCQGATTEHAFVLLSPAMNRSDILVAASRARQQTRLFLDIKACDAQLRLDLPLSERRSAVIEPEKRLAWLAARLGRLHVKSCTLDLAAEMTSRAQIQTRERDRSAGYSRD